ncbi:MAG: D-hexose-6-phosphate mutarotase [Chloroflexota bacterium]
MTLETNVGVYPEQTIQIKSPIGGVVEISPYGAHVLSWMTPDGDQRMFLSPRAEFRMGAAIRGGVPVIFPQFSGMGPLPKHGFARTKIWEVDRLTPESVVFSLSETPESMQVWPYRFLAEYSIRLLDTSLEMAISVTNRDSLPISFTIALHTYLRVDHVSQVLINGLQGLTYKESANLNKEFSDGAAYIAFTGEVDRIYLDIPGTIQLIDGARNLRIQASGFSDAVIWNPGAEKCASLGDLRPDGYKQFVCVESASIGNPVNLLPGETWQGVQTLSPK